MMGKYVFCVEKEVRVAMHKVHIRLHNSIIKGSKPGCGTVGFPATPGWDPVRPTGLVFLRC